MKYLLILTVFLIGCSNTKELTKESSVELRIKVLEEKFKILDQKVDSLKKIK